MSAGARGRRWRGRPDLPTGATDRTDRDLHELMSRAFRDSVAGGVPRRPGDLGAEDELRARLRALRAEMPRRGVGTVFPEVVRARARRHRARARVAGAAALVVAVALGVGLPVSLAAGPSDTGGVSPAVAARAGSSFGGMTVPNPAPRSPNLPDTATAAAVKAAFHDVFTHGVTPAQFTAAVEDGETLRQVSDKVIAHFPQLGATIEVTVDALNRASPDTVNVTFTLTFTDPTIPTLLNTTSPYRYTVSGTAIRTADGWKVSRGTYCSTVSGLGVPALACPAG